MWAVNVLPQEGLRWGIRHPANGTESTGLKTQCLGAESPFTEGAGL